MVQCLLNEPITQKLRDQINSLNRPFGMTPTGIDWCIKALHPSDPLTEVRGIPDRSAVPSLCMNYQTTSTLTIAPAGISPWAWDMTLLPHPVFFAYWDGAQAHDPVTGATGEGNFSNSQLGPAGSTPDALVKSWLNLARRWRLCYMAVTVLQDGPDLANQGTIAVCQSTFEPRLTMTGNADVGQPFWSFKPAAYYDQSKEGPNFERAQAMPNAMLGRSREGAYVPLKLTDTCQKWQSESDGIIPANLGTTFPSPQTGSVVLQQTFTPAFPFPAVTPLYGTFGNAHGDWIPALMNGSVAHICARNLSKETSFTFQFRMGVEIQLDPSSTLTPQLKLSPPYDPLALETYFAIARELKDGYPADYNCIEKMWEAIKGALKFVAPPLLGAVPGGAALIPLVNPFLEGVTGVGREIRSRRRSRRQKAAAGATEEWATAAETEVNRAMRERAEEALARKLNSELSQAEIERLRADRAPTRPVGSL